ncbi:MAG: 4-hydroxy-3-methylbut-2-enyl diphosphate reductase [bacterium]|nr:4-hydroxy-3-methylbut-2-enyl diphosphate reductase [bacterium]
MKVLHAPSSGFCFGVRRSIDIANQTIKEAKVPVYTYGPIIHNPQVVKQLESYGIHPIKSFDNVPPGKLIIRSHGVSIEVIRTAVRLGFDVVDATCPFVKHAQDYAKALCDKGYEVIVIGEREHPEVQGIVGHTGGRAKVINYLESIDKLPKFEKLGIVAQTTLHLQSFMETVMQLLPKAKEMRVYNTICEAVIMRQKDTLELAKKVDIMIVVGGKNSANTTRLAEFSRAQGCDTYHIETKEEINKIWFNHKSTVGVTAGASTPDWIIDEVIKAIKQI